MSSSSGEQAKVTVFFDGSCPLCSAEIGVYRNCRGAESIEFVDVAKAPDGLVGPGLEKSDALKRFHIRDSTGEIVSGGRAFAVLWTRLPALHFWGRLFQTFPLSIILEWAYRLFLPLRPTLQRIVARFS